MPPQPGSLLMRLARAVLYTLLISRIPHSIAIRTAASCRRLAYISSPCSYKSYGGLQSPAERLQGRSLAPGASKVDDIVESLKTLTLLETTELIKKIEEAFGVVAQGAPQGVLGLAPQSAAPAEPYKDEEEEENLDRNVPRKRTHTVVIKEIAKDKLYQAFKVLKAYYTDISAIEIKKIMDSLPYQVKTVNSKREAEEIVKKLTAEGMKLEIE